MFLTLYFIFPLILYFFPSLISKFIIINAGFSSLFTNLCKPNIFKFNNKNWLYLRIKNCYSNCELGAWAIISKEDEKPDEDKLDKDEFLKIFSNGRPIIIYFHGITMNRGSTHRVKLYHLLRENGFHVATIDYKGFGDSSGSASNEEDLLEDAFVTYNYVRYLAPKSPIFIWGHSLGTGISSLLMKKLSILEDDPSVSGLILESPFTSIVETMDHIIFTLPWRWMPYFNRVFKQSLFDQKISFNSIENLKGVNVPILIMHAEDDSIVSFEMGKKLYTRLSEAGKVIYFKAFPPNLGYGHKYIVCCPELPNIIREFTTKALTQK